jgi:hypothetical protein
MAPKPRVPARDSLTIAGSFVKGALGATRGPTQSDPPPDQADHEATRPRPALGPSDEAVPPASSEGLEQSGTIRPGDTDDTTEEVGLDQTGSLVGDATEDPTEETAAVTDDKDEGAEELPATADAAAPEQMPPVPQPARGGRLRGALLFIGGVFVVAGFAAVIATVVTGRAEQTISTTTITTGFASQATLPAIAQGREATSTVGVTPTMAPGKPGATQSRVATASPGPQ